MQLRNDVEAIADACLLDKRDISTSGEPSSDEIAIALGGISLPSMFAWRLNIWKNGIEHWEEQIFQVTAGSENNKANISSNVIDHAVCAILGNLPATLTSSPDMFRLACAALSTIRALIVDRSGIISTPTYVYLLLTIDRAGTEIVEPALSKKIKNKIECIVGKDLSRERRRRLWNLSLSASQIISSRLLFEISADLYKYAEASANYRENDEYYWQSYCRFRASLSMLESASAKIHDNNRCTIEFIRFQRAACLERMGARLSRHARNRNNHTMLHQRALHALQCATKHGTLCVQEARSVYGTNADITARRISMLGNALSNTVPLAPDRHTAEALLRKASSFHELAFWEYRYGRRGFVSAYNWACTLFKTAELSRSAEDARIAEDAMAAVYERAILINEGDRRLEQIKRGWHDSCHLRCQLEQESGKADENTFRA